MSYIMFFALVTIYVNRRSTYSAGSSPLRWLSGKPAEGSTSFEGLEGKSKED